MGVGVGGCLQLHGKQETTGGEAETSQQEKPLPGAGGLRLGADRWVPVAPWRFILEMSLKVDGDDGHQLFPPPPPQTLLATALGRNQKKQMEKRGKRSLFFLQCFSSALY